MVSLSETVAPQRWARACAFSGVRLDSSSSPPGRGLGGGMGQCAPHIAGADKADFHNVIPPCGNCGAFAPCFLLSYTTRPSGASKIKIVNPGKGMV